jgi:hypothetical protein
MSSSIRAISVAIKASLSTKSGGGVIHTLTHIQPPAATGKFSALSPLKQGVSNYK